MRCRCPDRRSGRRSLAGPQSVEPGAYAHRTLRLRTNTRARGCAVTATYAQPAPVTSVGPAAKSANRHKQPDEPVGPGAMDAVKASGAAWAPQPRQFGRGQKPPANPREDRDHSDQHEDETDQIADGHLGEECADLPVQRRCTLEHLTRRLPGPRRQGLAQATLLQEQVQTKRNNQQPQQLESKIAQESGSRDSLDGLAGAGRDSLHSRRVLRPLAQGRQQNAGRIRSPCDD